MTDELLVQLFYAAQGNITRFRIKARELLADGGKDSAGDAEELSLRALYEDACIAANKNAKYAERYQWLRRRAVMMDYSDEAVTTITLFKDEGPTGEFLDDQIDCEIAKDRK